MRRVWDLIGRPFTRGAVGRLEILQVILLADQIYLRMTTRNRGVVDLDKVIGSATDRDQRLDQFMW